MCREALQLHRETLGDRNEHTLDAINNLAKLLHYKGDLLEAEALCKEALNTSRETLGFRHKIYLVAINNYVKLLQDKCDEGDLTMALPLRLEAR